MIYIWEGTLQCYDCGKDFARRYAAALAEHIDRGPCPHCKGAPNAEPYVVFRRLTVDAKASERVQAAIAEALR